MDNIDSCQRPVFSLGVSQHKLKLTNLWKFELNWSSELRGNNDKEKTPWHEVVCFQMLDFETSKSNSTVSKSNSYFSGKFFLSRKLRYFRGSRFAQCFYTVLHCLLPILIIRFLSQNLFWILPIVSSAFKNYVGIVYSDMHR